MAFYEYDFGDSWLHRLELESQRPADEGTPPVRLVGGARRGPLEDSGGLPGYEEIMAALADVSHPDHDEYSAWVTEMTGSTEPFDPAFLDIADMNRTLAKLGHVPENSTNSGQESTFFTALPRPLRKADIGSYDKLGARDGESSPRGLPPPNPLRSWPYAIIVRCNGSQAGIVGIEERAAYGTSKAGLIHLTKILALEWPSNGIRLNAVAPTFVRTELTASTPSRPDWAAELLSQIPIGRFGEPEEIADSVAFLLSDAAKLITGHTLAIDGGYTIR